MEGRSVESEIPRSAWRTAALGMTPSGWQLLEKRWRSRQNCVIPKARAFTSGQRDLPAYQVSVRTRAESRQTLARGGHL